jgi:threonine synthase
VRTIPGDRAATSRAAEREVEDGTAFYASHVWNPLFLEGVKTYAYELWEQRDHGSPGAVVVPVGNGTMLLGAAKGFVELHDAGLIEALPQLVAVQAASCAPVFQAVHGSTGTSSPGSTVAEGIAIAEPPRLREMADLIGRLDVRVELVTDDETRRAQRDLARQGLYVEPTAAVSYAAARRIRRDLPDDVVVPLCGAGLKSQGETQ